MNIEQNLLFAFVQSIRYLGLTNWLIWGQLLIVIASLAIGHTLGRYVEHRANKKHYKTPKKTLRAQKLASLVFPLSSFILILLVKAALEIHYRPLYLLNLVNALLLSMVVLRVIIRMLQITFSTKPWARQSERWVFWSVWVMFALYVTGFSEPMISALQTITFHYGKTVVSMWDIVETVVVVVCTLLVSLMLSQMIEMRLLQSATGDVSLRVVIARLVKAFFIILAFMIALPLVGIDLTVLSVFGGALGVGLGLGLQKIASNYVSGFILLLDRSLRIGDIIQVGSDQGQVQGLTARYIALKALNGTVSLIPNDTLISSVVINRTYYDPNGVILILVRVPYHADIKLALQLLINAAQGVERVLIEPAPAAVIKRFTENGIDLELSFWIADQEIGTGGLESTINMRIWESFNEHNISFSSPIRDINLISLSESVDKTLTKQVNITKD